MAWKYKHPKSGRWIVAYRINGKIKNEYLAGDVDNDTLKAKVAEAASKEANAKIGKGLPKEPKRPKMTYAQFAPLYLAWREADYPDSYETVSIHINAAVKKFGHLPIACDQATCDLWNDTFNQWSADRTKQGASANTIWGEWKDIKASLYRAARTGGINKGQRWKLCDTSPAATLVLSDTQRKKKAKAEKIAFTPKELQKLYAADPKLRAVWRFLANTGLRRSELEVLPLGAVETGDKARVRILHDPDVGLDVKDNESRSIPLNAEALAARDEILANHDGGALFFPRYHKRTWTRKFNKARRAAKLSRGTLHCLRHTFISRAANNGVALHLVADWAGHEDLATTKQYLHINEDYEWMEMDKMLATEKENEKVVEMGKYRKAS